MMDVELLPRLVTIGSDGYEITSVSVRYNIHVVHATAGDPVPVGTGTANLASMYDDELKAAATDFLSHVRRVLRVATRLEKADLKLIESSPETDDEPL